MQEDSRLLLLQEHKYYVMKIEQLSLLDMRQMQFFVLSNDLISIIIFNEICCV